MRGGGRGTRWRLVAVLVAAVLAGAVAAGCGGDGSDGGQAATAAATTSAPAPTKRELRQKELRRYLAQSRVANGFYQRGRSIASRSIAAGEGKQIDDPGAASQAKEFRRAASITAEASVRQRITEPPKALRGINRRFAQDMGQVSDRWDGLAGAISNENLAAYNAVLGGSAGGSVRNEWRLQVTAYGRKLGIPLPKWAQVIGKSVP